MNRPDETAKPTTQRSTSSVIEIRVISPPGSRVVESEIILSEQAAKGLETRGHIPPVRRRASTSG